MVHHNKGLRSFSFAQPIQTAYNYQMQLKQIWYIPLILLVWFLAIGSMVDDSITLDEQNHIARGWAYLQTRDAHLNLEHPPLINTLSALPLKLLQDVPLPLEDASWTADISQDPWYSFAYKFLWEKNAHQVEEILFLSRLPIVFLYLGLGITTYHLGRTLWHKRAGMIGMIMVLLDPNIMAHGRYTTTDLGATLFVLLTLLALWHLFKMKHFDWRIVLLTGLALGCGLASKLSTIGFIPAWFILAMFTKYSYNRFGHRIAWLGMSCLIGILTVWAIFGFEMGTYATSSDLLGSWNGQRGPLPTFLSGVDRIFATTQGGRPSFLAGEFSDNGFGWYFPIAILIKTPMITLFLFVISFFFCLLDKARKFKMYYLLIPLVWYFGLSIQSNLNIGYRHLLPVIPLIYLIIVGYTPKIWRNKQQTSFRAYLMMLAVGMAIVTNLTIFPHYLSYFNTVAGGGERGWRYLVDSNIDWGQDLYRLQDYMNKNGIESVKLGWFGASNPANYIEHELLPGESYGHPQYRDLWWNVPFNRASPEAGWYAISVHNLQEMPLRVDEKTVYQYFRDTEPTERIGYSIYLYEIK